MYSFKTMQSYAAEAEKLGLSDLYKEYAMRLACEIYGDDNAESGVRFVSKCAALDQKAPLSLVVPVSGMKPEELPQHIHMAQAAVCLPLMERERYLYIGAHYSMIRSAISFEYWDPKKQDYDVLKNRLSSEQMTVPYELDVTELGRVTKYNKRIMMLNSVNLMHFYAMYPEEKARWDFLADAYDRLEKDEELSPEDMAKLFGEHDKFVKKWTEPDPNLFMKEEFERPSVYGGRFEG